MFPARRMDRPSSAKSASKPGKALRSSQSLTELNKILDQPVEGSLSRKSSQSLINIPRVECSKRSRENETKTVESRNEINMSMSRTAFKRTQSKYGQNQTSISKTNQSMTEKHYPIESSPSNQLSQSGSRSESYLSLLAENFHSFYEQKLRDIEKEAGGDNPAYFQKRNSILKQWITDLIEQNQVLIDTVDEMEREAAAKLMHLEEKCSHSNQLALNHFSIIQDYEQQVQHLLAARSTFEEEAGTLRSEVTILRMKGTKLEETLNSLETENENLISLITRIRDWGVWDISDLRFTQRTYYRIFELYPHLAGSEVQTVFTRERAKEVQETEKQLGELKVTLQNLQEFKQQAEQSLNEKDNMLCELRNEREDLREKLRKCLNENSEYQSSLDEARRALVTMTAHTAISTPRTSYSNQNSQSSQLSNTRQDMTDMLQELRDLRNQLSIACTERQNAVMEANALRDEMNSHLQEVQHMKDLLVKIQSDAQNTKTKVKVVQDRQDQLATLKDQVNAYQLKYEEAREMLNIKSDTIQNLQRQMNVLILKVSKIENENARYDIPSKSSINHSCHSDFKELKKQSSKSRQPKSEARFEIELDIDKHPMNRSVIDKPPWNEYFIKGGSLEESSQLLPEFKQKSESQFTPKSSQILRLEKQERKRQQAMRNDFMENHRKRNAKLLEQRNEKLQGENSDMFKFPRDHGVDSERYKCASASSSQISAKTITSVLSRSVAKYFSEKFGIPFDEWKHDTSPTCNFEATANAIPKPEYVKLPPIVNRSQSHIRARDEESRKKSLGDRQSTREDSFHLPRLVKRPEDKSVDRCKTMDALVTQAMRISKEMIDSFDPCKGKMSAFVRASHRNHRCQHFAHDEDLNPEANQESTSFRIRKEISKQSSQVPLRTLFKAKKEKSRSGHRKKSDSETDRSLTSMRRNEESIPNTATGILAKLPSPSQEYIVKDWIYKNGPLPDIEEKNYNGNHYEATTASENNTNYSMKQNSATTCYFENKTDYSHKGSKVDSGSQRHSQKTSKSGKKECSRSSKKGRPSRKCKPEPEPDLSIRVFESTSSFSQHSLDSTP